MIMWNVIRAAGVGAYLMLWASVTWGLVATTSLFGKRVPKATSVALHQAFSTLGLLLLVTHLGVLLVDSFMPFGWLDLLIPMRATYRPAGVVGIGAMVLMAVVLLTSWFRTGQADLVASVPRIVRARVLAGARPRLDDRHRFAAAHDVLVLPRDDGGLLLFLVLLRAMTVGSRRPANTNVSGGVTPPGRRSGRSAIYVARNVPFAGRSRGSFVRFAETPGGSSASRGEPSASSRTTSTTSSTSCSRVRQFTSAGRNATFPS